MSSRFGLLMYRACSRSPASCTPTRIVPHTATAVCPMLDRAQFLSKPASARSQREVAEPVPHAHGPPSCSHRARIGSHNLLSHQPCGGWNRGNATTLAAPFNVAHSFALEMHSPSTRRTSRARHRPCDPCRNVVDQGRFSSRQSCFHVGLASGYPRPDLTLTGKRVGRRAHCGTWPQPACRREDRGHTS